MQTTGAAYAPGIELSAKLRALFAQAITATNALSTEWIHEERDAWMAQLDQAMKVAGFPLHDARTPSGHGIPCCARNVYRASQLTPTQRAAAIFLAQHPEFPTHRYPLPGAPWAIRRWLGLDAPGVLFEEREDGRTPYEALRSFDTQHFTFQEHFATLHWRDRRDSVQALTDLSLLMPDCRLVPINELHALLPEIDGSLGTWALARAQWLLDDRAQGQAEVPMHVTMAVLPPIYLALMRAGLSNAPHFDVLLTISRWCSVSPDWLIETQCALVNAISEERREAALISATDNLMFETERVHALQQLLPYFPYPAVAAYLLAHAHEAQHPKRTLEAVQAVAETNSAIATLYEAHMNALGAIPKLRAVALVPMPPCSTLSEAQKAQLAVLGRRWSFNAEQMLAAASENDGELNLVVIEDEYGPVFEAWLNEGDEGNIFRADTTEEVAWMGQGGIPECDDKALLAALREALAWSRLAELRQASGGSKEGPWSTYRAVRDLCDESDAPSFAVNEVSGDGTIPPLIVPHDDDIPF